MEKFNTDPAGVLTLISGIGLGRLCSYFVTGYLSDKLGRRLMIYLGITLYLIFFIGILFSPNIKIAFFCAMLGGVANACLDTGTYPALMEAFPRASGSVMVMCKAAISFGQMLYPLAVTAVIFFNVWFGLSFIIPIVLLLLNLLFITIVTFPNSSSKHIKTKHIKTSGANILANDLIKESGEQQTEKQKISVEGINRFKKKPRILLDGIVTVLFGFSIFATFYTFVQSVSLYGMMIVDMDKAASLKLVSYYSLGSLICVFTLAVLLSRFLRPVLLMFIFPIFTVIALVTMLLAPSFTLYRVAAFVVGFTAAGGLLQLGIAVLNELFPDNKAKMTSVYMFFGSVANMIVPLVVAALSFIDYRYILGFNIIVASVAVITGAIIFFRYYSIFKISQFDIRFGEGWIQKLK